MLEITEKIKLGKRVQNIEQHGKMEVANYELHMLAASLQRGHYKFGYLAEEL